MPCQFSNLWPAIAAMLGHMSLMSPMLLRSPMPLMPIPGVLPFYWFCCWACPSIAVSIWAPKVSANATVP
jgi:hypothetical protein